MDNSRFIQLFRGFENNKKLLIDVYYRMPASGERYDFIMEYYKSGNIEFSGDKLHYKKIASPSFTIHDDYLDESVLKFRDSLNPKKQTDNVFSCF